ncbi:hypothetical protein WDU94_014197 [Cyamophila willieti]
MNHSMWPIFTFISILLTVYGTNDFTTVYKIDTIKSDMNEVKYLNTCSVSVRVQPKDEQYPLFSINDNSSILDWRQIPPLYSDKRSNWTVDKKKTMYLPPVHSDYINPFYSLDMNLIKLKGHNFFKYFTRSDNIISYTEKQPFDFKYHADCSNYTVYSEDEMEFLLNRSPDLFSTTAFDVRPAYRDNKFGIKLYWSSNKTNYIQIIVHQPDIIRVCTVNNGLQNCTDFPFLHGSLKYLTFDACTWFGIILEDDEVNIYNCLIDSNIQYIRTNHFRPKEFNRYTEIEHEYFGCTSPFIIYDIEQIEPMTLHSPWFKLINTNTSLFILYFTEPGYELKVFLEEKNTGKTTQLKNHELDRVQYTERINRVLVKVGILQNGTGNQRIKINGDKHVFIGNIWEQTNLDIHKEHKEPIVCDKSNIIDIYNTLERTTTNTNKESTCRNGGRLENGTCVCPPGFADNQCQTPCGRNHFGEKCSFMCSYSSTECKGMILCTPYYGCTCAPGYSGEKCSLECEDGFYGADCSQACKQCTYGCNKYTGACRDQCSKHPMHPNCRQNHSYLRDAPDIVGSNFTSVKLQVNFTPRNILGSIELIEFYMVQHREDVSPTWSDGPYENFEKVLTNITVNDLKPGRLYQFRVVLIDYSQETQDTLQAKISQSMTNCTLLSRQQNLQISNISTTTIGLYWDSITNLEEMECPLVSYLLELEERTETGYAKPKQSIKVRGNSFLMEKLKPGKVYSITLKKLTILGKSESLASKYVTTDSTFTTKLTAYKTTSTLIGLRWNLPNINLTKVHINIEVLDLSYKIWNKTINMSISLLSYRCKPWPGFTCFDMTNLVLDTKYNITVKLSNEKVPQQLILSKSIVAETKETSPSSVGDVNLQLISGTSLSLSWRIPFDLNGILRKFIIQVEHVSSFVQGLCCQSSIIDLMVNAELEIFSHVLHDIKAASSYQITIRPLAKGLGPKVIQTIETPPPRVPFQRQVVYSNQTLQLHKMETNNEDYDTLTREILVIVEPKIHTNPSLETLDGFQYEISEILGNNNWWLTHVCAAADELCKIDLTLQTKSTDIWPIYGKIERKPLQSGEQYRIVLVQVNQYQSARSYTVELFSITACK